MLQLFFKASSIHPREWENAYDKIVSIAAHFPLKLLRVEAYNGYQPQLNKDHFELRENIGTADESLAFYGDWTTYTTGTTIRFYKQWEKYLSEELKGQEQDASKPITWFPHYPFRNNGSLPEANGLSTQYGYIDTREAAYEFAILAIGIMLENQLPGKVFLTAMEQHPENIEDVVEWLTAHFGESFELPIYFDKKRLLDSFIHEYADKSHSVCRMAHLFCNQHKKNMAFAIENIGYQAALDCYADVLSSNTFGTFGFSDVLHPWIAVTQNLESTLELVALSKKLTLEQDRKKDAAEYDLTYLLKQFLEEFILWTPQQREELEHFYTNKEALETGDESLWGMIYRMAGRRVDICPMYSNEQDLFEAFMYHQPKDGKIFKQVIEEWVETNADSFAELKQKLADAQAHAPNSEEEDASKEQEYSDKQAFLDQYLQHERPFMELALHKNPAIFNIEARIENMCQTLHNMAESVEHRDHIKNIQSNSKEANIAYICRRIKRDIECCVNAHFEQWLKEEEDENVLFFLTLMLSLKIYDRSRSYVRYRILWDKAHWNVWRKLNPANPSLS